MSQSRQIRQLQDSKGSVKKKGGTIIVRYTAEKELSWKQLKEAAMAGRIRELVNTGDEIPVRLKTGEDVTFVVAFDESGKLFFATKDCLKEPRCMNEDPTNKGGWAASELRKIANTEIFDSLPDDLQEVIVPTKIVQVIDGEAFCVKDKLFCFSFTQIAGRRKGWEEIAEMEPYDSQLDIFKDKRARVKDRAGEPTYWWERSLGIYGSYTFMLMGTSSYPYYCIGANYRHGVALGFCIHDQ